MMSSLPSTSRLDGYAKLAVRFVVVYLIVGITLAVLVALAVGGKANPKSVQTAARLGPVIAGFSFVVATYWVVLRRVFAR